MHLKDQFEWPLFSTFVSPEQFSRTLCCDLGVGGEFIPSIAHAIREQTCFARINFEQALGAPELMENPLRPELAQDDWEPELRQLTGEEVEKTLKEKERSSRRLRRSQKFTPYSSTRSMSSSSVNPFSRSQTTTSRTSNMRNVKYSQNVDLQSTPQSRNPPRNYHQTPTDDFQQFNPQFSNGGQAYNMGHYPPHTASQFSLGNYPVPSFPSTPQEKRKSVPMAIDTELAAKQVEMMRQSSLSPVKSPLRKTNDDSESEHAPPTAHRGFGASAGVYNQNGNIPVGGAY